MFFSIIVIGAILALIINIDPSNSYVATLWKENLPWIIVLFIGILLLEFFVFWYPNTDMIYY